MINTTDNERTYKNIKPNPQKKPHTTQIKKTKKQKNKKTKKQNKAKSKQKQNKTKPDSQRDRIINISEHTRHYVSRHTDRGVYNYITDSRALLSSGETYFCLPCLNPARGLSALKRKPLISCFVSASCTSNGILKKVSHILNTSAKQRIRLVLNI